MRNSWEQEWNDRERERKRERKKPNTTSRGKRREEKAHGQDIT
jgi:hypothetical protein